MPTERQLATLKINKMSNAQYGSITKSPDQLYLTPNETIEFDGITGTTLDTQVILHKDVMVFKDGILLRKTAYSISGSIITFVDTLTTNNWIGVRI